MRALLLALLLASPAAAQVSYPPIVSSGGGVDAPTMSAAIAAAVAPKADASALAGKADASAIPPSCTTAPAPDTVGGTLGTGTACVQKVDAARATQVMPSTATTAADGTFSGTWPGAFASAPTTAFAQAKTTADPYTCQIGTATTTAYSGKCWKQTQVLTLPSSALALLSLQLTTAALAPAGITVMVVGRQ